MKTTKRRFPSLPYALSLCGLALAIMICSPDTPAMADSLSLSVTAPGTVTEGTGFTVATTLTYAGTTAGDLYFLNAGTLEFFYTSGDKTDAPKFVSETGICGAAGTGSLGTGPVSGACTITDTYATTITGADTDMGVWQLSFVFPSLNPGGILTDFSASTHVTVTGPTLSLQVVDPSTAVPEPSTMLLLGTGLVGMLGALRRKLIS